MIHSFELTTDIRAPIERCFDLSRSIDLHIDCFGCRHHRAVAGRTTGLIGPSEIVVWRAKYFGIWWKHASKITAYNQPTMFVDEMIESSLRSYRHEHRFEYTASSTVMRDIVRLSASGSTGRFGISHCAAAFPHHPNRAP